MTYFLISAVLLLSVCGPNTIAPAGISHEQTTNVVAVDDADESPVPAKQTFAPAAGMVVFEASEQALRESGWRVKLFNADGRVFHEIDVRDDSIESLDSGSSKFYPFYFSNGASREFAIELRLERRSKDWLEVVANERQSPKSLKYVRADDPLFRVQSWDKWVLNHFNLRFDAAKNPVRESPEGSIRGAQLPPEPLIKPESIKGDWVFIRWTEHEADETTVDQLKRDLPANSGWIRWREGDKILIREFVP